MGWSEAIILAAGSGRRLGNATNGRPKCLVEVGGRTILERQMRSLREVGVSRFVVVCGYRASDVEAAAREGAGVAAVAAVYNERYAETNVLTSWIVGSRHLEGNHIYTHADTVFSPALLDRLVNEGTGAINLTYDRHECGAEEMKVRLEGGELVQVSKAMESTAAHGEFTGIMSVQGHVLPDLRAVAHELLQSKDADLLFVEAALQELLDRGRGNLFSLVDISGIPWREIDFPEDLASANQMFANG